jgi:tRNA(fMet)-specific endonuclease VapC
MICLDTNAVIAVLNDASSPVRRRMGAAIGEGQTFAVSVIVLFELRYGATKSARPERNARRIDDFLAGPIELLPFGAEDADEAGDIRAALEHAGTPIGPYDILIAAQARCRDALLVTANAREFTRVPRLRSEDWAAPP